jgi:hypothetical protein
VSWIFIGFYLELFECSLNLKILQIQTIFQNLYSNICKTLTSNFSLILKAQLACLVTQQPVQPNFTAPQPNSRYPFFFFLFLYDRPTPPVMHLYPFLHTFFLFHAPPPQQEEKGGEGGKEEGGHVATAPR